MRIIVDLIGAQTGSRFRGIGRYTVALVKSMIKQRGENDIILIANKKLPEGLQHISEVFGDFAPGIRLAIFDVPMNASSEAWRIDASELLREYFIQGLNPDFVLVTSIIEGHWENAVTSIGKIEKNGVKTGAIFYDLIPLILQKQYLGDDLARRFYTEKAEFYKHADLLLCISESSLLEAKVHLGIEDDRLANISAATDSPAETAFFSTGDIDNILSELSITQDYIFCAPGGFDPRKNIRRLFEAFSLLPSSIRNVHSLVIASKILSPNQLEIEQWMQEFGIDEKEVVLTGYLEDKILRILYRRAKLFVFPSFHEGFGLPVLEAMTEGCPVLGSNTTSIPEVIGLQKAMFNPHSSISISRKICDALSNPTFYNDLADNSKNRAALFSWERSGALALQAIERACTDPGIAPPIRKDPHSHNFTKDLNEVFHRFDLSSDQQQEILGCAKFNNDSLKNITRYTTSKFRI